MIFSIFAGLASGAANWVRDKVEEQQVENQLRAIIPPDQWNDAIALIDDVVESQRPLYEREGIDAKHLRVDTMRIATRYFASTGRLPKL